MSKTSPAIVAVSKFSGGKSKKFSHYIKYIDRIESQRNQAFEEYNMNSFDGYNHYMGNPEKSSALFTSSEDCLNQEQKQQLKKIFEHAQDNDSIMWQDVISFDNKWLEKKDYYNSKTGELDEHALMDAVRAAQARVLENEGMSQSAVWSAAIHYNTKHIHVHIATVEPNPTRDYQTFIDKKTQKSYEARRGYRHASTLDKMKATVASKLVDRSVELKRISELTRQTFVPKEYNFCDLYDHRLVEQYNEIYAKLPADKSMWRYNMNGLKEVRPLIDSFVQNYIEFYHRDEYAELTKLLDEQVKTNQEIYGTGTKEAGRYEDFKQNKLDDLATKMGNSLLKDMLEMDKELRLERNQMMLESANKSMSVASFGHTLERMGKTFRNQTQHRKNQRAYQKLIEEQEKEKER